MKILAQHHEWTRLGGVSVTATDPEALAAHALRQEGSLHPTQNEALLFEKSLRAPTSCHRLMCLPSIFLLFSEKHIDALRLELSEIELIAYHAPFTWNYAINDLGMYPSVRTMKYNWAKR